jgi:hypothetical protein
MAGKAIAAILAGLGLWGQTAAFDAYRYQPPPGYTVETKPASVIFSKINQARKYYCQIVLYQAQRSQGSAAADFDNEWKAVVVPSFKPTEKVAPVEYKHVPGSIFAVAASLDGNGNKAINTLFVLRYGDRYVGVLYNTPNDEAFQACRSDAINLTASIQLNGAAAPAPAPAAPVTVSGNSPVGRWQRVIASQLATRYNPFSKQWEHDPVAAMNQFRNSYTFEFAANGTYVFTLDAESFNRSERSMVVEKGTWAVANGAIQFKPQSIAEGKSPRGQTPALVQKATPGAHARRFTLGEHPQYKDSAGLQLQTGDGGWETYKPLR